MKIIKIGTKIGKTDQVVLMVNKTLAVILVNKVIS